MEAALLSLEVLITETSSKADVILMNLGRVQRSLMPNERRIAVPPGMPKLPLGTRDQLNMFEEFLANDGNLAAVVCISFIFILISIPVPLT